jgi:hypothetical protein
MTGKRHTLDLGQVILTKGLAQAVVNVLFSIFPGYGFTVTQRDHPTYTPALRDTWAITLITYDARPLSSTRLQPVFRACETAYLTALRFLTGGTRECAALGPFANRLQVINGFTSAAAALGGLDASCITTSEFSDTYEVSVTMRSSAEALRVARAAAASVGCALDNGAHGTANPAGYDRTLRTLSGLLMRPEGALHRYGGEATRGVGAG